MYFVHFYIKSILKNNFLYPKIFKNPHKIFNSELAEAILNICGKILPKKLDNFSELVYNAVGLLFQGGNL